jgi:hypothetical protein
MQNPQNLQSRRPKVEAGTFSTAPFSHEFLKSPPKIIKFTKNVIFIEFFVKSCIMYLTMKCLIPTITATLLFTNALAYAGTAISSPTAVAADTAESGPEFEVSLGYDTNYIFRGEELFKDTAWGQLDAAFNLSSNTSLSFMGWYADAINADYNELDIHADLNVDAGFAQFSAGYASYIYPRGALGDNEGIGSEDEAVLSVSKSIGKVDLSVLAAYNFDREGTYFEFSAGTSIPVVSKLSLDPSVVLGYSSGYFAQNGLTHVLLTLAAPISLTDSITLKPYIAGNIPLSVLDENQDARFFAGVALSFSF